MSTKPRPPPIATTPGSPNDLEDSANLDGGVDNLGTSEASHAKESASAAGQVPGSPTSSKTDSRAESKPGSRQESSRQRPAPLNMPGMVEEKATPTAKSEAPSEPVKTPESAAANPPPDRPEGIGADDQQGADLGRTASSSSRLDANRPKALTLDNPIDRAKACLAPLSSGCIWLGRLPMRAQAGIEQSCRKVRDRNRRARVEVRLKQLAIGAGDLISSDLTSRPKQSEINSMKFNAFQVVEAFRATKPKPQRRNLLDEAMKGRISWGRLAAIILSRVLLLGLLLLCLHLFLAMVIYGMHKDVSVDSSGGLVDHDTKGHIATATTVQMKPLWDYPGLRSDELRRIEDVVFVFNSATHVLHVSVVERALSGAVVLKAVDGDTVRVEPSGLSYWRRVGHPEVFLDEMEAWRHSGLSSDPDVAWLTSGILSTQVALPE